MNRRFAVLGAVFATSLAFSFACGEASLKVTKPTPTPDDSIDCSFSGGVMETFATRDCGNAGCHGQNFSAQLQLVSPDLSNDEIYDLLLDSGGIVQRTSNCHLEWEGCEDDPGNPPSGEFCCIRDVRPGFPGRSLLLQKPFADSNEGHGGGKQFGSDEDEGYLSIECWIEDGAPNN